MTASPLDESQLRWRWERPISVLSVLFNFSLMGAAMLLVVYGTEWLEVHPFLAKRIAALRVVAIAAIVALPGIAVLRNARRGTVRGNSVRLSRDQIPELHAILEEQCQRLGVPEVPELYLTDTFDETRAFSAWKRNYIVIGTDYLGPLQESRRAIEFFLGRQMGALRLGHTKGWNELLMWYVLKLPGFSLPVQKARVLSLDRCGAYLAGGSLRVLLLFAVGRHLSRSVNLASYLDQVSEYGGFWDRVGAMGTATPPVARRVKELQEAGLLGEAAEDGGSTSERQHTGE